MNSAAAAIALGYGFVLLALLGHRSRRRPWLLAAFGVGAVAFPVTVLLVTSVQSLVAALAGWDPDAYSTALGAGVVGAVTAAAVNEIFKLAAALLPWSASGDRGEPLAFGAAAGAGFAAWGARQVIYLALVARALPIGSWGGFVTSLAQQFAFVAVHSGATALAAFGVGRGRVGTYLGVAIAWEAAYSVLGLLFALRLYTSTTWTLLGLAVGLGAVAYAFRLGGRGNSQTG